MPVNATLQFIGGAQQVTGSCYLLEFNGSKILLDCGMVQGADQIREWHKFRFAFRPEQIELVILSHAHIDHSGLLPLLVARGFSGRILCTPGTAALLPVLLKDSVHLYLKDLEWQNRKAARSGRKMVDPVLSLRDVERVAALCQPVKYKQRFFPLPGMELEFADAGHILGSAITQLWLKGKQAMRQLVFSGDLGNPATVLMNDPVSIEQADIVLMESTYGNRDHQNVESSLEELATALEQAYEDGGNVFIPAFALGRSQEIIYYLAVLYRQGRLKQRLVFLDSPMAISITRIYDEYIQSLDQKDLEVLRRGRNSVEQILPILRLSETAEDSAAINRISGGAIVIAGSGMCNGGRIVHHLKHNLWKSTNHLIFVGFQAQGTLGRRLVDGEKRVKLFGQDIVVKARIHTIGGFSAHAGQSELLEWATAINGNPVFYLVHGEQEAQQVLQQKLAESGITAHIPAKGDVIEL